MCQHLSEQCIRVCPLSDMSSSVRFPSNLNSLVRVTVTTGRLSWLHFSISCTATFKSYCTIGLFGHDCTHDLTINTLSNSICRESSELGGESSGMFVRKACSGHWLCVSVDNDACVSFGDFHLFLLLYFILSRSTLLTINLLQLHSSIVVLDLDISCLFGLMISICQWLFVCILYH